MYSIVLYKTYFVKHFRLIFAINLLEKIVLDRKNNKNILYTSVILRNNAYSLTCDMGYNILWSDTKTTAKEKEYNMNFTTLQYKANKGNK
jgi:hypothetical protein